jgi:hypothetical protein
MKRSKLTDIITRLGGALEKDAGRSLVVCSTNVLGYALFREHGLQILPDESHEIDTGGSCVLIVSARADVMSGLALRIKDAVEADAAKESIASFCLKLAELLKAKRDSKEPGWEAVAMKDAVSMAIGHFSKSTDIDKKREPRKRIDPFTGQDLPLPDETPDVELGGWGEVDPMYHLQRARRSLRGAMDISEARRGSIAADQGPIMVCGVAGIMAGKRWLPLVDRATKLTTGLIRRIVARLVRLKCDPSYAQAVLQEMLARSTSRNRR